MESINVESINAKQVATMTLSAADGSVEIKHWSHPGALPLPDAVTIAIDHGDVLLNENGTVINDIFIDVQNVRCQIKNGYVNHYTTANTTIFLYKEEITTNQNDQSPASAPTQPDDN